jgi:flagellar M-ring protein FliF
MPPQLQALLQNRNALIGLVAGAVLLIVLVITLAVMGGGGGDKAKDDPGAKPLNETQKLLVSGITPGRAIEMQALLARSGIRMNMIPGTGGTFDLSFTDTATLNERDSAMITLVQSGLMDASIGFEAFDKSDLMASREEKRIKLIRAQQGELSRIIRKIKPIDEASVRISVPDPTIFSAEVQAPTVAIQVALPPGERLTRDKVRAIVNLTVGSVQSVTADHVALSDTNGNTYNSVLNSTAELHDKMEEQDTYMKQKVGAQLDKLVGPGHYVVSVSTLLRESARETMVQAVDPYRSGVRTKQSFSERLNNNTNGENEMSGGPVSSFIPPELQTEQVGQFGQSTQNSKGYVREGTETSMENGRTQYVETSPAGMVEDISIAVTIDEAFLPSMAKEDLQELSARSASPKVIANNVTIATSAFDKPQGVAMDTPLPPDPDPAMTWLPWAIFSIATGFVIVVILIATRRSRSSEAQLQETTQEIEALRTLAQRQQEALQQQNQATQQALLQQQQQLEANQQALVNARGEDARELQRTLRDLRQTLQQSESPVSRQLPGAGSLANAGQANNQSTLAQAVRQWLEN